MKVFAVAIAFAIVATPALAHDRVHHHRHIRPHAHFITMDTPPFAGAPWMSAAGVEPQHRMTRHERRMLLRAQRSGFGAPVFGTQPFGTPSPGFNAYAAVPRPAMRETAPGQGAYAAMVQRHAAANGIPASLVHRVIMRESRYNPRAASKGNYGIMQIKLGTARAMGYTGTAAGLLDPEVNMTYAVKYLAGAYKAAGGSESGAVANYARGYYHQARRRGLSPYEAPGAIAFGGPRQASFRYASAHSNVATPPAFDRHAVF